MNHNASIRRMKETTNDKKLVLVILDIRSVQNTASLFRTADCVGVSKIYLVGTTPTPIDRFGRERNDFKKISLGAEKNVPHEYVLDINGLITDLKKQKYLIIALEQSKDSIDYKDFSFTSNTALIVGNEVSGVPQEVLEQCDSVLEILMQGVKESLNVSVAGAITLFRIIDKK